MQLGERTIKEKNLRKIQNLHRRLYIYRNTFPSSSILINVHEEPIGTCRRGGKGDTREVSGLWQ